MGAAGSPCALPCGPGTGGVPCGGRPRRGRVPGRESALHRRVPGLRRVHVEGELSGVEPYQGVVGEPHAAGLDEVRLQQVLRGQPLQQLLRAVLRQAEGGRRDVHRERVHLQQAQQAEGAAFGVAERGLADRETGPDAEVAHLELVQPAPGRGHPCGEVADLPVRALQQPGPHDADGQRGRAAVLHQVGGGLRFGRELRPAPMIRPRMSRASSAESRPSRVWLMPPSVDSISRLVTRAAQVGDAGSRGSTWASSRAPSRTIRARRWASRPR